ncbi:putative MFS family arabinose efflux permease [Acetoanaerobium pronyense]|uniref:MFS family arabinose efflux permease n=1 Tax=Acetoanaerobium pronyense TaxID=1482736 RepID=A0ABS4KJ85_9FIRM|nr:putative MFS family arabinose efflux permease [Acetoanaerobium pronyense]
MLILLITFITGLASEGLDRLWIAHFIENFSFPDFINISLVMWIGIINSIGLFISILISQIIIVRLNDKDENRSTKLLFFISLIQALSICIFALAGNFSIALISYLSIYMLRTINEPLNSALVSKITDSNIMSTVISTQGQINSVGQIIGGPIIGIIATRFSISYGILTTSIIILPTVFLYFIISKKYFSKNFINLIFEYSSKDVT